MIQEDGSGAQEFFYGPLGEVVKNIRTIVIPQHDEQTYTTEWTYDYSLAMSYNPVGGIESKTQLHGRKGGDENEWDKQKKTSYSMAYKYRQEQPKASVHIGKLAYIYLKQPPPAAGNQTV